MVKMPTYEQFKQSNDRAKKMLKGEILGKILSVQNIRCADAATCRFQYYDNISIVPVKQIVMDVYFNDMGLLANPSAIKTWSGWGREL